MRASSRVMFWQSAWAVVRRDAKEKVSLSRHLVPFILELALRGL